MFIEGVVKIYFFFLFPNVILVQGILLSANNNNTIVCFYTFHLHVCDHIVIVFILVISLCCL